ncbi:MAG: M48 family metalloprotease [Candidatus Aminicenantes bacterium]|nr:M48 family metalloprotease [Candidatus Aminicenantes bacterium]
MSIQALISNPQTADAVLNLAAQSMVLLLAGWIFSLIFRRASAPWRSGGMLALILILALWPLKIVLFPTASDGLFRIPVGIPISDFVEADRDNSMGVQSEMTYSSQVPASTDASAFRSEAARKSASFARRSIPPAVMAINSLGILWILGTLVFLVRILYGIAYLSGFKNGLKDIKDPRLTDIFGEIRTTFPAMRFPPVYSSPAGNSPIAFGLRRPRIVLPENLLDRLSSSELKSILIHEAAHLRHHDQLAGVVQRLVAAIYWWNPLVYALTAGFSVAREEVSDNYGILQNGARPYAECLYGLARKADLIIRLPFAVGIATPHISLEERIMDIISRKRNLKTQLAKPVILGLALIAIAGALVMGSHGLTMVDPAPSGPAAPAKIIPLPMVKRPMALTAGKERIYLLDFDQAKIAHQIVILSASDFSHMKTFGKKGQGPGEFLMGPGIPRIVGNSIWCYDINKMVVFSPDGDLQKEILLPHEINSNSLLPIGSNYVTLGWEEGYSSQVGRVFDQNFRVIKQFTPAIPISLLYPPPPPPPPRPGQKETAQKAEPQPKTDYQAVPDCIGLAVADDKIFFADTREGFHIGVFDAQGNPLYEIKKNYETLKIPADFQDAYMKTIRERSAWLLDVANIQFREFYPAFMSFKIADGKIYLATYAQQNGLNELIVMNLKGDILKRSFSFPLSSAFDLDYNNFNVSSIRYDICDGQIYFLMKDEKTNGYELHIQSVD